MHYCLLASTVDASGLRRIDASDRAAVHWALESSSEVIAVCPDEDERAWEYALAAGVNRVLSTAMTPDSPFEMAWAGVGFVEREGDLCVASWAERHSAPLLYDVVSCGPLTDGTRRIVCDAGNGERDELHVRGPCVLILSPHVARSPYISRSRLQRVRQHAPLNRVPSSTARKWPDWSPARPRVRSGGSEVLLRADSRMDEAFAIGADRRSTTEHVIVADPETCAQHLLRYLAHHGFVKGVRVDRPTEVVASEKVHISGSPSVHDSRGDSPSVQRRPRWTSAPARSSRGPFWKESHASSEDRATHE